MGAPRYGYYTPRAHAIVNGYDIAITSFQASYPLNGVPRCSITLPTGRNTRTNVPAAIHTLGADIGAQTRIQVYAKFTPTLKSDDAISSFGLPEKDTVIFDGYTCGGGSSKGTSHIGFSLYANGGLIKMSQASALSDSSCTANPANYTYPALMRAAGDAGSLTPGDGGNWSVATQAYKFFTQANIQEDMWGKAIYPWFKHLTEQNGIWVNEPGLKVDGGNKQAATALALLAVNGKHYKPLALRPSLQIDIDAATAISNQISRMTYSSAFTANQTLWDILVGQFAANFGFAIVPRCNDALVAPYLGAYRGDKGPYLTIAAGEYDAADHEMMRSRPLRAYGVLSAIRSRAGTTDTDATPAESVMGIGGWFDAGKDVDGAVMIEQAPGWLSNTTSFSRAAAEAAGAVGKPIGSTFSPGAGTRSTKPQEAKKRAETLTKPLLDAYAQVRFAQETLKGRSLVLSGPFRLDAAPGSLLGVAGAAEQFIEADQLATGLYGDAQMISLVLDTERPAAGTSFHLGNVRTIAENDNDRSSIKEHPLFTNTFLGAPLVDA